MNYYQLAKLVLLFLTSITNPLKSYENDYGRSSSYRSRNLNTEYPHTEGA